jgi:hypothetical protein
MLRDPELKLASGETTSKFLGMSKQSYYRWRKEYGGMYVSQVERLKGPTFYPAKTQALPDECAATLVFTLHACIIDLQLDIGRHECQGTKPSQSEPDFA